MKPRTLTVTHERWPLAKPFRIARGTKTHADVVVVTLEQNDARGRGECVPYARYGETIDSVMAQIESLRPLMESATLLDFDSTHPLLMAGLKAGAARNALDCALWDLDCKQRDVSASWNRNLPEPRPRITAFTLSIDAPKQMARAAKKAVDRPVLKMKLAGDGRDLARLEAVHKERPDARLILDANEGLDLEGLKALADAAAARNTILIEQPLPADQDAALEGFASPAPLCADESLHTSADLDTVARRYQAVNIKLDKAGGFDEAARLAQAAKARDMIVMTGCMVATSLAMAPAFLITPLADVVDLDGPLLLKKDRDDAMTYEGALMLPPDRALWG